MDLANILPGLIHQIALKPEYRSHMFHCPVCRKVVRIGYEERKRNKCDCGQKLDWGEQIER